MHNVIAKLRGLIGLRPSKPLRPAERAPDAFHVVMPDSVEMPLPRAPREEMRVPASINGRDLSTGRL